MQEDSKNFTLRTAGDAYLRVVLQQREDRFQQTVLFVPPDDGIEPTLLLRSFDGEASSAWPESPPIQACQIEPSVGILGTGMAGTTHWSLAITASNDELIWDVACRYKTLPTQLGSCYHAQQLLHAATNEDGTVVLAQLPGGCSVFLAVDQDRATSSQLSPCDNGLIIRPSEILPPPVTARWLYRLTLRSPSASRG